MDLVMDWKPSLALNSNFDGNEVSRSIKSIEWKCKINFTNSIEKRTVQVFSVLGQKVLKTNMLTVPLQL
jgi:hypothetical protein